MTSVTPTIQTADQDWSTDSENTSNWSLSRKVYNTAVPALLCFTISFGLSIYSPVHFQVQEQFHVSSTLSLLPFTLYVYGLAFGPIISAPLSETYGRRLIYLIATPISLLFTLGAGFANNFATLVVCRFFAGVLGSSPLAVGAGTIMDLWGGTHRARATALFFLTPFLGPALGPAVGGYIAEYKGWQWSQWTTLFLGGAVWVFSWGARETYGKIIIRTRAKKLGLPLPPKSIPPGAAGLKYLLTATLTRPVYMLVSEPIVGLCSLYTSFNFAVLFCFFAAFPSIFQSVYGFSSGQAGLVFLGIAIGCITGTAASIIIDQRVYSRFTSHEKHPDPEKRLWGAMVGSVLMPVALFWFAWTARQSVHWIGCVIATAVFGCANILIFVSCVLYLTDVYGALYAASALAANGLLRYALGGSFPLFTLASMLSLLVVSIADFLVYNNLGVGWATSVLGFLATGFIPLPWVFYRMGRGIRKRSGYVH